MSYLNVLNHLKEFKVDRIILDTFTTAWTETGSSTATLSTDHTTTHTNSLKIEGISAGDVIYKTLTDPLRLDDRKTIKLHLYTTKDISPEDISFVLSDGESLQPAITSIDLGAVTKNIMNNIELTIPEADKTKLSNIRSIGLIVNTSIADATVYLSLCDATTTEYIVTVEDLEEKIKEGETFVLSKLGNDYSTIPADDSLTRAVYMAAAGYAWLKQKENEQYQNDYGVIGKTKNYGTKLLYDAGNLVNQYIIGGSVNEDGSGTVDPINPDCIGGSDVWGGRIT